MFLLFFHKNALNYKVARVPRRAAVLLGSFLLIFCFLSPITCFSQIVPGHAHNDYEHDRPLLEALENNFTSVEVDVHLVEGELYVAHDRPTVLDPSKTLEALYLDPLLEWVNQHNGSVYKYSNAPFYLMIDFKTNGVATFARLQHLLEKYKILLTKTENGQRKVGPVTVFISGNRPTEILLEADTLLAALDGRPKDLASQVPTYRMPVISENFRTALNWNGIGKLPGRARKRLRQIVRSAHRQDKKVRFWAAPDTPEMWKVLLKHKVDLINTDRISAFAEFYRTY